MTGEKKRNKTVTKWKDRLPVFPGSMISTLMVVIACVIAIWTSTPVLRQELISQQGPPPTSVEESTVPMEQSFTTPPTEYQPLKTFTNSTKEGMKNMPAFFRDTKLDANVRTYYFYRDKFDDTKSEALAIGASLVYKSGYLWDHFALGAAGLYLTALICSREKRRYEAPHGGAGRFCCPWPALWRD